MSTSLREDPGNRATGENAARNPCAFPPPTALPGPLMQGAAAGSPACPHCGRRLTECDVVVDVVEGAERKSPSLYWLLGALAVMTVVMVLFPFAGQFSADPLSPSRVDGALVGNYGVVVPGRIYRSAQPSPEGMRYLFEHGLKGMINLMEDMDELEWIPRKYRRGYFHVPIKDHHPPTAEQMMSIIQIARHPEFWPLDIHCRAGKGRAGIVVAILRYALDGWDMDRALQEAREYRGGDPLNDANLEFARQWAETHPPGEYSWLKPYRPQVWGHRD